MTFEIRLVSEEDIQICAEILAKEFGALGQNWTVETAVARVSELFSKNPKLCFCLELDEKVIGILLCDKYRYEKGSYLYFSEFALSKEFQGKGFGSKALQFIENFAKKNGFAAISINTREKGKAIHLYEKFGFKRTGYVNIEKEF